MGSAYRAYDNVLGRTVAVKLLAESYADDDRAVRRFLREARAAGRLSGHPHVITIYDVGDADGCPYLVMEHLAGGTVTDALRIGAAPLRTSCGGPVRPPRPSITPTASASYTAM